MTKLQALNCFTLRAIYTTTTSLLVDTLYHRQNIQYRHIPQLYLKDGSEAHLLCLGKLLINRFMLISHKEC